MESLIKTVRRTLRQNLELRKDATIVIALSGGADSVALLAALMEEKYTCVAAHCNFHLRGEESVRDMRFVEQLTERLGVDLYVKDFNVPAAMAATGESVEMACRRLRYEWFDELLSTIRASDVAVGHHREDNVETFFLNLARGTGIAGLTGMAYRRGCVVRPLLDCTRGQIEAYLKDCGLDYVTDSSNKSNDYLRNRLRNTLLPAFEELLPGALDGVERTMSMLSDARSVFDTAVNEASGHFGSPESGSIDVAGLSKSADARILLFELMRPSGFNMTQVENILSDPRRSGMVFMSAGNAVRAELSRGLLKFSHPEPKESYEEFEVSLDSDIEMPVRIKVEMKECAGDFKPEISPAHIYLDISALSGNPRWCIRKWRRGDRLRPFGMTGSRLVSDVFSDAKMTAEQKRAAWILTRNDRIIWVVGVRASCFYPVGPRTKRYLALSVM